jgi:lysophospholipase L1-like esterase
MFVSATLCLLIAEFTIRFLKSNTAFQPDPDLIRSRLADRNEAIAVFETEDNLNGRSNQVPDRPIPVGNRPTNNLGLRMAEPVGPKQPGEHRILLLGDSFSEAIDAPYERRFDGVAERKLRDRGPEWKNWRIINGAIQNGCPSQYLLILRQLLPLVEPDVVVVVTGSNDLGDDMAFEEKYGFVLDDEGVPLRPRRQLQLWLLQKSFLLRYTYVLLERFAPSVERALFPYADDSLVPLDWTTLSCELRPEAVQSFEQRTGRYLRQLAEMSASAGAEFGVIVLHYLYSFQNEPFYEPRFPWMKAQLAKEHCYEANARPYVEFIDAFLARNRIRYRDTRDAFNAAKREAPQRKLWNFHDYHFSLSGHQVMGAELGAFLMEMHPTTASR